MAFNHGTIEANDGKLIDFVQTTTSIQSLQGLGDGLPQFLLRIITLFQHFNQRYHCPGIADSSEGIDGCFARVPIRLGQ